MGTPSLLPIGISKVCLEAGTYPKRRLNRKGLPSTPLIEILGLWALLAPLPASALPFHPSPALGVGQGGGWRVTHYKPMKGPFRGPWELKPLVSSGDTPDASFPFSLLFLLPDHCWGTVGPREEPNPSNSEIRGVLGCRVGSGGAWAFSGGHFEQRAWRHPTDSRALGEAQM